MYLEPLIAMNCSNDFSRSASPETTEVVLSYPSGTTTRTLFLNLHRLALAFFFALSISLFFASSLHAQGPTVEQVAEQLEQAAQLLEQGQMEQAKTLLEEIQVVELADGQQMELAHEGWQTLLDDKRANAPDLLRQAAADLRQPATRLPADARQQLEEVLARPEFQPAQPTLWQRLVNWLAERFPDVGQMEGSDLIGRLLVWLIVAISVLVVGGVLFSFLRGLRRSIVSQEVIEELGGHIPLYASQAQQQATEAARGGDFREAMRLLYLAALLHLDEVGLIRFDRALTNQEVLDSVANNERLRDLLTPVVSLFDRVWYGHAPFGEVEFEQVSQQIEEVRAMEASK